MSSNGNEDRKLLDLPSPGMALYAYARRRIWDGDAGRGVRFWETFLWSAFALYFGLNTFGFIENYIRYGLAWGSEIFIFLLTPMTIGAWVYRAHASAGSADESLRALPLRPSEILMPRMKAVLVTWLRIYTPLVLMLIVAGMIPSIGEYKNPIGILASFAYSILTDLPNFWLYPVSISDSIFVNIFIIALAAIFLGGGVTAPIAWGFWWATRFKYSATGFIFSYFFYYILIGFLMSVISWSHGLAGIGYGIPAPWFLKYGTLFLQAVSLGLITFLCVRISFWVLGRRV